MFLEVYMDAYTDTNTHTHVTFIHVRTHTYMYMHVYAYINSYPNIVTYRHTLTITHKHTLIYLYVHSHLFLGLVSYYILPQIAYLILILISLLIFNTWVKNCRCQYPLAGLTPFCARSSISDIAGLPLARERLQWPQQDCVPRQKVTFIGGVRHQGFPQPGEP